MYDSGILMCDNEALAHQGLSLLARMFQTATAQSTREAYVCLGQHLTTYVCLRVYTRTSMPCLCRYMSDLSFDVDFDVRTRFLRNLLSLLKLDSQLSSAAERRCSGHRHGADAAVGGSVEDIL